MLDEKDLQTIESMMDSKMERQKEEILKESAANMQVIIENTMGPQFKLLFEKLDTMEEKMVPQEAIEDHEERLDILEATVKRLSREVANLKKAL